MQRYYFWAIMYRFATLFWVDICTVLHRVYRMRLKFVRTYSYSLSVSDPVMQYDLLLYMSLVSLSECQEFLETFFLCITCTRSFVFASGGVEIIR